MAHNASKKPQQRLRQLVAVESNDLWVAVIYSAAIGLFTLALPVATQSIVNTIALGNLTQPLIVLSLLVLATRLISGILQALRIWVVESIQRRIFVRVSSDTVNRLLRAPVEAFEAHHGPELVNRFFDVVTLQKSGATLMVDGLGVVMQTLIGMILLGLYHPWLLAFDFILLACILVVVFPMGVNAVATSVNESKAKYALVAWLQETARFNGVFKSSSAMSYATGRTDGLVREYLGHRSSHFRILVRQILGTFVIHAIASATLLGVGGWLVMNRELTLGQLVAAELVVELVLSGFSKLGKHLELYYDLCAAVDKLGYLQDLPLEPAGSEKPHWNGQPAAVRLDGVGFAYPGKGLVLRGAELDLQPGRSIALTGQSGAGKSTIFDMIYGLRLPTEGTLAIEGVDARRIDRTALRDGAVLVRDADIFEGTVLDNVRVGRALDPAAVRGALAAVGLLDDIMELPQGLDTPILTGGLPLSSGQAMRLALARAIAGNPRLLMIDESLDHSADTPRFRQIAETLFAKDAPWTLLLASSHDKLISRCDSVYRIEDARLEKVR